MTLHALRTTYTLADLCDMHEAMRAWDEVQAQREHETGTKVDRKR
ncbi:MULTISPECIES: hypothetical protein [Burkholderia]|nr:MULTISPECIES: hypothetical protein [Burkholderia]